MSQTIRKGNEARNDLVAEVEALFVLKPIHREKVLLMATQATDYDQPDRTYQDFYVSCRLDKCEIQGQPLETHNEMTEDCTPDGGWAEAPGLAIRWQRGAVLPDGDGVPWNGCFLVTVLQAAKAQLEFYQNESRFACNENENALGHVTTAIAILNKRQIDRFIRGVRGKHKN